MARWMPLRERFWDKVDKRGPDECWPWKASINPVTKYGQIGCYADEIGGPGESWTTTRAHRAAWILTNGLVPKGHGVLHTCDNPPCCNPHHLFTGTQKDNMADAVRKGRHGHGTTGGPKKIPQFVIDAALKVYNESQTPHQKVAKMFGISQTHLHRHINRAGIDHHGVKKLTHDQIREIRRLYETGEYSQPVLARQFGCCRSNIGAIVRGENWGRLL